MLLFASVIAFNTVMFFAFGGLVHWLFYVRRRGDASRWKHQPERFQDGARVRRKLPLVLLNSVTVSCGMAAAIVACHEGFGHGYWAIEDGPGPLGVVLSTFALFLWYHVSLYYFHRFMHRPAMFRRFHRVHHSARSPMFLDALYEHPVEALYGAFVLSAPVVLFPVWGWGYIVFASIVGLHEIIDHCGIDVDIPVLSPKVLSRSKHHDDHHARCHCYYGQLLPTLDRIHGTDRR